MAMMARPAISATVIPTIVVGFSLLWFGGDSGEGFVGGEEDLGITAIAGEVVSEMFCGSESVEGIKQGVFSG